MAFKRITQYDDNELTAAIDEAIRHCKIANLDFYTILKGVDAYMEKRNRKNEAEAVK
jgi:hypothetical protein